MTYLHNILNIQNDLGTMMENYLYYSSISILTKDHPNWKQEKRKKNVKEHTIQMENTYIYIY